MARGVGKPEFNVLDCDYLNLVAELMARKQASPERQAQAFQVARQVAERERARFEQSVAQIFLVVNAINGVNYATSLDSVLRQVLDSAINLAQGAGGAVMLFDEQLTELNVRDTPGDNMASLLGLRIPVHNSLAGKALLSGQARTLSAQDDHESLYEPVAEKAAPENGLHIPLMKQEKWIGVLSIYGVKVREFPDPRTPGLFLALANEAALAIERAQLLGELTSSEERYRTLAERLPLVLYRANCDAQLGHSYVNHAAEPLLGYSQSQWPSEPGLWVSIVNPHDRATIEDSIRRAQQTRSSFSIEYRLCHSDGHWVWVKDTGKVYRNDQGEATWIEVILEDVSDRHRIEEELITANQSLKEAIHAKEAFMENVSHELRTPLNA